MSGSRSICASGALLGNIFPIVVVFLLWSLLSTSSLRNSLSILLLLDSQRGKYSPIQINPCPKIKSETEVLSNKTYVFVNCPVEDVVILKPFSYEQIPEDLAEVGIIRLVIESQGASIVEVNGKFVGEATAKDLGRGGHLLLHDTIVLLLLGSSLQSLPRKRSTAEVEHDISQGFHVIAAGLLCNMLANCVNSRQRGHLHTNSQMGIDGRVSGCASQVFIFAIRNVKVGFRVAIFLCQTEVNNVDLVATLSDTHEKVVGLDVTVDKRLGMDVFDTRDLV